MTPKQIKIELNKIFPDFIHLLKPQYRKQHSSSFCPKSLGFCYIATEAAYNLIGSKHIGVWRPKVGRCGGPGSGLSTHWWLEDPNGIIFDVTDGQFYELGLKPPYQFGRFCWFLTSQPSKRATKLMSAVHNGY